MDVPVIFVGDTQDVWIQKIIEGLSAEDVTCEFCSDAFAAAASLPSHKPAGLLLGAEKYLLEHQGKLITLATDNGWRCGVLSRGHRSDLLLDLWAHSRDYVSVVEGISEIRLLVQECDVQAGMAGHNPVHSEFFANAEEITALLSSGMDDE